MPIPASGVSVNHCAKPHEGPRPGKRKHILTDTETATGTTIDLLLIYNGPFANRYPGSRLATRLNHLVEIANQTMANTELDIGFRLVGHHRFDYRNDNSNFDFRNDIAFALSGEDRQP